MTHRNSHNSTTSRRSTTARGYGTTHQALRKHWARLVQAGQAHCHASICLMRTRWIAPGSHWDLGHTPDRSEYSGPEHRKCNRADGARRGNRQRARHAAVWTTSRQW